MSVQPLRPEKDTTVDVLLAQIKDSSADGIVAVVLEDGCWRTCWTSGICLNDLTMAAMKLQADVIYEIHREEDQPFMGWTRGE